MLGSSSSDRSTRFGQNASLGGFGPARSGSTFQQTQPTFGSNAFSSSTPAFGAMTSPAFGALTAFSFGATTTPAFGATTTSASTTTAVSGSTNYPSFGSTTTSLFDSTGTPIGVSTTSLGSINTPAFGAKVLGSSSSPAFGVSTRSFGSSTPFGASTPSFGQSLSTSGGMTFGAISPAFGSQSSSSGAQTAAFPFGNTGFGQTSFVGQQGGSRVEKHTPTPLTDAVNGKNATVYMQSMSAMEVYKGKSHEELRWADYQRGDKEGSSFAGQPAVGVSFPVSNQPNPFSSAGTLEQTSANPFSNLAPTISTFGSTGSFPTSTSVFTSPFTTSSPSSFSSISSASLGFSRTPVLGLNSPTFNGFTTPPLSSSTTVSSTQSSGLFQSSTPCIGQTPSPLGGGQSAVGLQQTSPTGLGWNSLNNSGSRSPLGQVGQNSAAGLGWNLLNNAASSKLPMSNPGDFCQTTPSLSPASQPSTPALTSGYFSQTQPASSMGLGSTPSIFAQGSIGQLPFNQPNMVIQPVPTANPWGTLPALPKMSPGQTASAQAVQYGISSIPVSRDHAPMRTSTLSAPRHLSRRRIGLPVRKYNAKIDGPKVPFFVDDEETQTSQKADLLFIPRENPRSLVIHPIEQWPSRASIEKKPILKDMHNPTNKKWEQNRYPQSLSESTTQNLNGVSNGHLQKEANESYITISGHTAGKASIVFEHGADMEALMPKLCQTDYYTEPRVQELAAKEEAEPGFCSHVKEFVVGRHGYGSIKFYGETDVRRLDLEAIVQLNYREVIVYKDESMKPPVGQGLNKTAEVTLLNVKCINKNTAQHYTEGLRVEKYKDMLMKKAEEQGAEFVSFDAAKGLWKF